VSRQRFLPAAAVPRLIEGLAAGGVRVFGPTNRAGRVEYRRIASASDLDLQAPLPAWSLKALFLPPTEPILHWRRRHDDVTLTGVEPQALPAVVLGARPCDAAGVAVLDKVMGWDYRDEAWFARRDATTIVAIACPSAGPDCFCETVGLGRASAKGADVLLTAAADGYRAEAFTEKGTTLFERGGAAFEPAREAGGTGGPPARNTDAEPSGCSDPDSPARGTFPIDIEWDDPLWDQLGLRCHGCGACAAVCPTCHCFDIVDEPDGLLAGTRRRNWDTCQAASFTLHASGHNPRPDQRARFRQRILHKFSVYPRRFGEVLCTGCGRCAAACPAGQYLPEILARARQQVMP
jgi:ferredoxin